ncbi:MAG: homoserine kinase [Acidiferrobacteraceae bacterium]
MSVFTTVSRPELDRLLADYDAGHLKRFEGIAAGIENTNYFVITSQGEFVLTVFEQLPRAEIPFFLELKAFLAHHGFPCAEPMARHGGAYLGEIQGKPASLVRRLFGASVVNPSPEQCRQVGDTLARLHRTAADFPQGRVNPRGPRWWTETAQSVYGRVSAEDRQILQDELAFQSLHRFSDLPRGLIHADLFRDNVLFQDDRLTGVIDFYYACTDPLMFDVAVTVNDWCGAVDNGISEDHARALVAGYQQVRPFTAIERGAWPALLRAAALRFWLSRLHDLHFPRPGEITHTKDPGTFRRALLAHRAQTPMLRRLLDDRAGASCGELVQKKN